MNKENCKAKFEIGQKFVFSAPVFFNMFSAVVAEIEEIVYTEKAVFYKLSDYGYVSEYTILHNESFQLVLSVETKGE